MIVSEIHSRCKMYHCIPERKDDFVQEMTFHHINYLTLIKGQLFNLLLKQSISLYIC